MAPSMLTSTEPKWVDYHGAVALTRLSRSTILRLVNDGKIKVRRIGRRVLFSIQELNDLVDNAVATA